MITTAVLFLVCFFFSNMPHNKKFIIFFWNSELSLVVLLLLNIFSEAVHYRLNT